MKNILLQTIFFIPMVILLILCRVLVNIPRFRNRGIDAIVSLLKKKYQKEIYIITISELPLSEEVEKAGRMAMAQIRNIEAAINLWEYLFGLTEKDYKHIANLTIPGGLGIKDL